MAEEQLTPGHASGELSALGRRILTLDLENAFTRLVVGGPGNQQARDLLERVRPEQLLARPVKAAPDAQALLAGLWLYHDWLDESHRIAQRIDTPTGSFWHAIMHRREGDFENSKHWYARCRQHPVMQALAVQAGPIVHPLPADHLSLRLVGEGWDPAVFVDLVETVHDGERDARRAAAVSLQHLEWRLLFDYCVRSA